MKNINNMNKKELIDLLIKHARQLSREQKKEKKAVLKYDKNWN